MLPLWKEQMEDSNFVEMAEKICKVTGKVFQADELLMDMRMRPIPKEARLIGYGICPEVQEKMNEGYIPLVCIDSAKSDYNSDGTISHEDAYRTGEMAYVRKHVLEDILDKKVKESFMFIDKGFLEMLNKIPIAKNN